MDLLGSFQQLSAFFESFRAGLRLGTVQIHVPVRAEMPPAQRGEEFIGVAFDSGPLLDGAFALLVKQVADLVAHGEVADGVGEFVNANVARVMLGRFPLEQIFLAPAG